MDLPSNIISDRLDIQISNVTATLGKDDYCPKETVSSSKYGWEDSQPAPAPPAFTSTVRRAAHNFLDDRRWNSAVFLTQRRMAFRSHSPQPLPWHLSLSTPVPRTRPAPASKIRRVAIPVTLQRIRKSVPKMKAVGSRSPQQLKASGPGVGGSPALRRDRMPSTARASMATPSRALHNQPLQPGSTRKERTEPPQAASQSARTINPRGVGGSRNVAPPKAFGGAEKQMAPSGSEILGMGTAQTAGRAYGMSQCQRNHGDDGKKSTGDKDGSIVSRTAAIKGSTTSNPALRAISKSQSPMPSSRSSLPVNARKNATVDARGGVTPGSSDKSATRRTTRELRNIAPPRVSANHDGGGEKTMAAESGRRLLGASATLTLGGIRGKKQDIVPERQATVTKDSTSASPAPRSSSKGRSSPPPSRLPPTLQVNARQKGATRPGARPAWRY